MKNNAQTRTLCFFLVLALAGWLFPTAALCEHTLWDCTVCGRTGNAGNFCGGCGNAAPWIQLQEQVASLTNQVVQAQQEKDSLNAQLTALQAALAEQQNRNRALDAENKDLIAERDLLANQAKSPSAEELSFGYTVLSSGGIEITAYKGNAAQLVIPGVLDGYSVVSIGEEAFYECGSLTSVIIPNSVTSIGNYAFGGCGSLTSVTIPNSVNSIGVCAFDGCRSLTSLTIPNGVTIIEEGAFSGCHGLTFVIIPSSVTFIGCYAFSYCSSLTSISILNSATYIFENAFYGSDNLTINGKANSTAATYAKQNNIRFVAL